MTTEYRRLRVALLGAGAVGSQVADLLLRHGDELADRAGATLELAGIAVRNLDAPRETDLPKELFTTDAESLILGSDIVIELIGGIEPARTSILQAIGSGADVVTANKALLATHGPELFEAADLLVLAKPQHEDVRSMREGQILWGWPHCVQDRELTQLAIDKRLLRSGRCRRDPDHPTAARLARRRPRGAHHGDRERHDQLHPRSHGH